MAKAKCKLSFMRLDIPNKIEYCRDRVSDMGSNALFATPDVPYLAMKGAIDDLETKYNLAQGGGEAQTAAQDAALVVLDDLMRKQTAFVDRIADGNVVIIRAAGFEPTSTSRTPVPKPLKPENVVLQHGQQPGTILINTKAQTGVKSWLALLSYDGTFPIVSDGIQITVQPSQSEVVIHLGTDRKKIVNNLKSGSRIYVKVIAVNAAGISPESDKIEIVVP